MKSNLFSIIIPTWNNLTYLKLCVRSIQRNSSHPHQIIVFVNDGSDGSLEWVQNQQLDYLHSRENAGVCIAVNRCRSLVKTDYIMYMNDDMYVCPGWDAALWEKIRQLGHNFFSISATMIEPKGNNAIALAPYDFGTDTASFDEIKLLKEYQNFSKDDWSGGASPPNVVHKNIWDMVGGYSIEFSPGMYSDYDFPLKLYKTGVRIFMGVGSSRVYHFMTKTTKRIHINDGLRQFIYKWGFPPKTFCREILKMGSKYSGPLVITPLADMNKLHWLLKYKIFLYLIKGNKRRQKRNSNSYCCNNY